MSWKEKRLITILSIILAVLCAAVLLVLSVRYRTAQAAKAENSQTSASDIAQAAQSDYITLSYQNGTTQLSFALNEDGEPELTLKAATVQSILALLKALKPQQTLDLPEDLSAYGLEDPQISMTATMPDGTALTVSMGNTTTDGNSYYAAISSDPKHIFIIANTLYLAMQKPIYEMCVLPELPQLPEDAMTSIEIEGPSNEDGTRSATVLTAAASDGGDVSWRSGGANVTDAAEVRALMEDLSALRVSQCVDFKPSDDAASFCGFVDPSVLTVNYKTSSGAAETFALYIGNQNMDGTGRYVRIGEESAVYLMELSLLDPMMRLADQGRESSAD